MGFGGYERKVLVVNLADPTADARINLLKVPAGHTYTVEAAEVVFDKTLAAGTANYIAFQLENAGTSGTAQAAISDSIGGTPASGTAAAWTAQVAKAFTITAGSGDLTAGQYLAISYDETGTVAQPNMTVTVQYVDGVGANA